MTWVIILSYICYALSLLKGVTQCVTSGKRQRVWGSEPHNNTEVTELTVFMVKWKSSNICFEAKSSYTLAQEACVFVHVEQRFLVCGNPFLHHTPRSSDNLCFARMAITDKHIPMRLGWSKHLQNTHQRHGKWKTAYLHSLLRQAHLCEHLGGWSDDEFGSNEKKRTKKNYKQRLFKWKKITKYGHTWRDKSIQGEKCWKMGGNSWS